MKKRNYRAEIAANEARIRAIHERRAFFIPKVRSACQWAILDRLIDEARDLEEANDTLRWLGRSRREKALDARDQGTRRLMILNID